MLEDFFHIKYEFTSQLGEVEGNRYVTSYFGEIYKEDEYNTPPELVGKLEIKLMLLGLAINNEYDLFEIFDMDSYTLNIGESIYDFSNADVKEDIIDFYSGDFYNTDICIIKRFEILPQYRRKGLGKKVMKDIYNRFSSSCGLFVVQAFPLQFEWSALNKNQTEWYKKMNFDGLEKDFEQAYYQLKSFYQKIGFDHINGYNEYMFLNPALKNLKLGGITLD
jgi:GNAT superfamily N-acetyltransferase